MSAKISNNSNRCRLPTFETVAALMLLLLIMTSIVAPSQAWTTPIGTGRTRVIDTRGSESSSSVKMFSSSKTTIFHDDVNANSGGVASDGSSRRQVFQDCLQQTAALLFVVGSASSPAIADDSFLFERNQEKNVSYKIQIPPTLKQGQKPVKTHLDEVNFVSETIKGYQFGITVDPVRINSLKEVRMHIRIATSVGI
jgi:hypothetical protein